MSDSPSKTTPGCGRFMALLQTLKLCLSNVFLPHVALLGLVSHQQVSVHLVHQLWSDPTYGHQRLL